MTQEELAQKWRKAARAEGHVRLHPAATKNGEPRNPNYRNAAVALEGAYNVLLEGGGPMSTREVAEASGTLPHRMYMRLERLVKDGRATALTAGGVNYYEVKA